MRTQSAALSDASSVSRSLLQAGNHHGEGTELLASISPGWSLQAHRHGCCLCATAPNTGASPSPRIKLAFRRHRQHTPAHKAGGAPVQLLGHHLQQPQRDVAVREAEPLQQEAPAGVNGYMIVGVRGGESEVRTECELSHSSRRRLRESEWWVVTGLARTGAMRSEVRHSKEASEGPARQERGEPVARPAAGKPQLTAWSPRPCCRCPSAPDPSPQSRAAGPGARLQ